MGFSTVFFREGKAGRKPGPIVVHLQENKYKLIFILCSFFDTDVPWTLLWNGMKINFFLK